MEPENSNQNRRDDFATQSWSAPSEIVVETVQEVVPEAAPEKFTTAELIAIYKLQKAGFVPSDFE